MNAVKVILLTSIALTLSTGAARAEDAIRYHAVFADGTRIEGRTLTGWSDPSAVMKLDQTSLEDPKRPLRWLRDRGLKPWRKTAGVTGYVEFIGGDRIIGRVVGSKPASNINGDYIPAHLLVSPRRDPKIPSHVRRPPPLRVLPEFVKKIVLGAAGRPYYRPGNLLRTDGRSVDFTGIRVGSDSFSLLLSDSSVRVKLADVAEIHFPKIDPWEAHFRLLGVMSPDCRSRMLRIETIGGLIATASELRSLEMPFASETLKLRAVTNLQKRKASVEHMEGDIKRHEDAIVQAREEYAKVAAEIDKELREAGGDRAAPKKLQADHRKRMARSKKKLDRATGTLTRHKQSIVRSREYLKRLPDAKGSRDTWTRVIQPIWCLDAIWIPFKTINLTWSFTPDQVPLSMIRPTASVGPVFQPWRADRHADGRFFHSGGREYCWGFAVHAYSELNFTLPQCVSSFSGRLGLDRIVNNGGCARARIFIGSTDENPVYASDMLIGAGKTVSTGKLAFAPGGEGLRRLILQADIAHHGRPEGSDPLNIRDKLIWLDPMLGFDPDQLKTVVAAHAVKQTRGWNGWDAKFDKGGRCVRTTHLWIDKAGGRSRFLGRVRAEKHPLILSRTLTVTPADNWITVRTGEVSGMNTFKPRFISLKVDGKDVEPEPKPARQAWQPLAAPLMFALAKYRGKKVTLELHQPADGTNLYWHAVELSSKPSGEYQLAWFFKRVGRREQGIPRALGWALQSGALDDDARLRLMDLSDSGAIVNFWNPNIAPIRPGELATVMVGDKWKGGDKKFAELAKVRGLKTLLIAADSGVSPAAVKKLQAARPDQAIEQYDRTPSQYTGHCTIKIRNHTRKQLVVHWSNFEGRLVRAWKVRPGATVHGRSGFGCRYEAYDAEDKLVRTCSVPVNYGRSIWDWEIRDK